MSNWARARSSCARRPTELGDVFLVAGAVVIDIGGALSHGAIAARELGVPCVINTRDGTRRLRTGDEVVVDGAAGTVEILCVAHPEPEETYS